LVVEPPHVDVQLARGSWVEPAAMIKQIKRAGFESIRGDVRYVVTGVVVRNDASWGVALDSMQVARTLTLAGDAAADSLGTAHAGTRVEIAGIWNEKTSQLQVTSWRSPATSAAP
jgi:hypothetical protein